MNTLAFEFDDAKAALLAGVAQERGLTVSQLMQQIVEEFLGEEAKAPTFEDTADYVLKKNAELHHRLAYAPDHVVGE